MTFTILYFYKFPKDCRYILNRSKVSTESVLYCFHIFLYQRHSRLRKLATTVSLSTNLMSHHLWEQCHILILSESPASQKIMLLRISQRFERQLQTFKVMDRYVPRKRRFGASASDVLCSCIHFTHSLLLDLGEQQRLLHTYFAATLLLNTKNCYDVASKGYQNNL